MHPRIYKELERICTERNAGGTVLEIGAIPNNLSLLKMLTSTLLCGHQE